MVPQIDADAPATWQELEARVARILSECGYDVEVQKQVELARGDVRVDVWADENASPPNVFIVECKQWVTPTTKNVVHGFRTVVGDSGANTGLIVSTAGFQDGAVEAAAYSNVRLLDWREFQEMFAARWLRTYMSPTLAEEVGPLHEYTEPVNSRVFRKADALPVDRREQFKILRERHRQVATVGLLFYPASLEILRAQPRWTPTLPLRGSESERHELSGVPDEVLDATALRPLMDTIIVNSRRAIAEFDEIFGERA